MGRLDEPIGIAAIDEANLDDQPSLQDFVRAASEYVVSSEEWDAGLTKKAQIRLSYILAKAIVADLNWALEFPIDARVGETRVGGALRSVNADVAEFRELDGLRLGVEIKPINLAVGRAIWNRFGDIRTFAVNLHLKFPFAVVGGVLTVPTYEMAESKAKGRHKKPTVHLIERAEARLVRAGNRETEGDAPHLLEAIGLIAFDPDTRELHPDVPKPGSGLRWEEFISNLANAYNGRFED